MNPTETKTGDRIGEIVDRCGLLDEDIKSATKELEEKRVAILDEATERVEDGQSLVLIGNTYKATVSYQAEVEVPEEAIAEFAALDKERAAKLFPFTVVPLHHDFTGDENAVAELKKLDGNLFKKLFARVPASTTQNTDVKEIRKCLHSDVKRDEPLRSALREHVTAWTPKTIRFARIA